MPKTCLDKTGLAIVSELYAAVSKITDDVGVLSMIGSWGDTLDDQDVLEGLQRHNAPARAYVAGGSARRRLLSS